MKKITKISFLLLAVLPLLKENYNSIIIILCCVLTIINYFYNKVKKSIKPALKYTIPFWFVLIYELISGNYQFKEAVRNLPFLIFPLLFYFKPFYINGRIIKKSIIIFQISVLLQCVIYSFIFLKNNSLDKLFYVSLENIPFFRNYVAQNYFFQIHPTYFSTFLLVSFTFSLEKLNSLKENISFNVLNIILATFYIFLFSSKIIFICLMLTVIIVGIFYILKNDKKKIIYPLLLFSVLLTIIFYPSSENIIYKRFHEIKTEYNKPIIGNYHNSINIRVAIIKCSLKLLNENPLFGYGNNLQKELNSCYKQTNKSNFYQLNTYNTHNHFINLILFGGYLYLLIFVFYLYCIILKIKHSFLGMLLLGQFLFICLTENFLSRHYGIVLFTYCITFLIFIISQNDSKPENIQTTKKL